MTGTGVFVGGAVLFGLALVALAIQGAGRRIAKAHTRNATRLQNTVREIHKRQTDGYGYTPDEGGDE